MYEFGSDANYAPEKNESLEARAIKKGMSAAEVAYDILLKNSLHNNNNDLKLI